MQTTVSTAPWWYVAALAGLFTVLGSVIAVVNARLADRWKAKREDLRRWDTEIRLICSQILTLDREIVTCYFDSGSLYDSFLYEKGKYDDLLAARSSLTSSDETTEQYAVYMEKWKEVRDRNRELGHKASQVRQLVSQLQLIAPPKITAAASHFAETSADYRLGNSDDTNGPNYRERVDAFLTVVRERFGVRGD